MDAYFILALPRLHPELARLPEGAVQDALLQVTIGEEPQKSGVAPSEIFSTGSGAPQQLHFIGIISSATSYNLPHSEFP